jgi:hypothetical protein
MEGGEEGGREHRDDQWLRLRFRMLGMETFLLFSLRNWRAGHKYLSRSLALSVCVTDPSLFKCV